MFLDNKMSAAESEVKKKQEVVNQWKEQWNKKVGEVDKLRAQLHQKVF